MTNKTLFIIFGLISLLSMLLLQRELTVFFCIITTVIATFNYIDEDSVINLFNMLMWIANSIIWIAILLK